MNAVSTIPSSVHRRYEPLVKVASGGTAAVWVGVPRGGGALVAIKRPHAHLADDAQFRRALSAEASIASSLRHPNVVEVQDVEEDEDGIQLVMRYVEGASLSELIRSWAKEPPPRPAACALRVVLDTCAGLAALHDLRDAEGKLLGLVHRDVSPANVLVDVSGVASIADFGLAKPLYAVERTTSEGALRGKLGYMAPEYIRGKEIDRRIDVFAMAIVVWEAVSRKRLFRGENDAATLERVQRMTPPSLAEAVPELGALGPALDAVLARALAKDPAARTAGVDVLAHEIDALANEHGMLATHAEVAASFGPSLREELDARRAKVSAALATRPSAQAAAVEPMPGAARRPRRAVLVVATMLLVTGAVAAAGSFARPPPARPPVPAASAASASPTSSDSPPIAVATSAPAVLVTAPPPPPRPSVTTRSPAPKPAFDLPGHKKPRPNPYGGQPVGP